MSGTFPVITETQLPRIIKAIQDLYAGRSNATGTFTLTPSATTTVVVATNCGDASNITWRPTTANAAAALGTTYVKIADIVRGQFTVTHASNAQVDRIFVYSIQG